MKKFLAIMLGVLVLTLAACKNDSESEEASGKEKEDQTNEEASTDQEAEVDMEALMDQLKMDATVETTSDSAEFNFSLRNTGEEPVILGFRSGQKYEIKVKNQDGESVYTYSADKMFTQALTTKELNQDKSFEVKETWSGIEQPGQYEATMTFLVDTINDQSLEANPFEVTQSFTIDKESDLNSPEENKAPGDETGESAGVEKYSGDGQAFRDIEVTGKSGSYVVKGEARVHEGSFLYSIEDGHNVQVKPTPVQVEKGAPAWSPFEIKINLSNDELPEAGTLTLTIFEESAKDGRPTNVNYVPLDSFQPTN